jgi:2-polyprenyl-6-methoxyphenol hydroxylase-like FAD-dependent oxidoreductase
LFFHWNLAISLESLTIMSQTYDVIIAGAGPIGLQLACELGLAGVTVLVLERDAEPQSLWKVAPLGRRGLNTPSVEAFYRRGLLSKFFEPGDRPSSIQKTTGFQFGGHFAGIMLNANKLELDRWKYRLPGPSLVPAPATINCIETVLTERAESLGVTILRGDGIALITAQNDDSVTVKTGGNQTFRGKWLVGCDGGRSVIRKAAGFTLEGTEAKLTGYAARCELNHPDMLKPGFHITKTGMYVVGPNTLHLADFDNGAFDRTQEITREHLDDVLSRISGITDVNITKVHLASSFTDRSKQATSYRKGRVLLAGDAAHIHSPLGAQGLNHGLGDAMNLGWKLAATIRQEANSGADRADLSLLDTYESERQPIAARVLEWSRAQVSILQPNMYGAAMQALICELIDTADGAKLFIDRFWGLSQRYNLGDGEAHAHPLVGCSAPDFELYDGSRLGSKLVNGRGLLIDFEDDPALQALVVGEKYEARVDYIGVGAKDRLGCRALLVRPDGVVAWVADENVKPDVEALTAALEKWFAF